MARSLVEVEFCEPGHPAVFWYPKRRIHLSQDVCRGTQRLWKESFANPYRNGTSQSDLDSYLGAIFEGIQDNWKTLTVRR